MTATRLNFDTYTFNIYEVHGKSPSYCLYSSEYQTVIGIKNKWFFYEQVFLIFDSIGALQN